MRCIVVSSGTLFQVAVTYLGDATQWTLIAAANDLIDPWLDGLVTLTVPDAEATMVMTLGK